MRNNKEQVLSRQAEPEVNAVPLRNKIKKYVIPFSLGLATSMVIVASLFGFEKDEEEEHAVAPEVDLDPKDRDAHNQDLFKSPLTGEVMVPDYNVQSSMPATPDPYLRPWSPPQTLDLSSPTRRKNVWKELMVEINEELTEHPPADEEEEKVRRMLEFITEKAKRREEELDGTDQ